MTSSFAADVVQTAVEQLPPWVWILAALGVGLALLVVLAFKREWLIPPGTAKAKDDQIAMLERELDKANERWKEERDQRIADAQSMATLKLAAQVGVTAMSEAAELFGERRDPYAERLGRPRRRLKASTPD